LKPIDSLSIYTAYSISYLPTSGDEFSTSASSGLLRA
jgi:catecholate siderophore receptor